MINKQFMKNCKNNLLRRLVFLRELEFSRIFSNFYQVSQLQKFQVKFNYNIRDTNYRKFVEEKRNSAKRIKPVCIV